MQKKKYNYKYPESLIKGKLIKRYNRFLVDIELFNGKTVVAHFTNSGSMKSCYEPGADVFISPSNNPKRKTLYTWELILINSNWVGINTLLPNQIVFEAIQKGFVDELMRFENLKREVTVQDSRFDIYAENKSERCFIEVKNVTYKKGNFALFPDAISARGTKHLNTLIKAKNSGFRAIIFYLIQRLDVTMFGPAHHIDSAYAETLEKAINNGVEVIAYQTKNHPTHIELDKRLPMIV